MTFCASASRSRSVTTLILFSLLGKPLVSARVSGIDSAAEPGARSEFCANVGAAMLNAAAAPVPVTSKFLRLKLIAFLIVVAGAKRHQLSSSLYSQHVAEVEFL